MKKTPDPQWYVYIEDFNGKDITRFNVFHSHNFLKGCKKTFKKYKDLAVIEEEIKSWAKYSFWSKSEYEVVVRSLNYFSTIGKLIDVYDQLLLNWDSFFRYVVEHKAYFLRRESKKGNE